MPNRTRANVAPVRALLASICAGALLALRLAPEIGRGACVVWVLVLPVAWLAAFTTLHAGRRLTRALERAFQLDVALPAATLALGVVASNRVFAEPPLSTTTLLVSASSLVPAAVLHLAFRRRVTSPVLGAFVLAATALELDLRTWPRLLDPYHRAAAFAVVVACALPCVLLVRHVSAHVLARASIAAWVAVVLAGFQVDAVSVGLTADEPAFAAHVVSIARRLVDRDGDGFSPLLHGGDCDDHDPRAHPLSLVGRDCLGFVPERTDAPAERASTRSSHDAWVLSDAAPTRIVLVTFDALRCGFVRSDRGAFDGLCPELEALAARGRARRDYHATASATRVALAALFAGRIPRERPERLDEVLLPDELRVAGFRTTTVLSHHALTDVRGLRESFDHADEGLMRASEAPAAAMDARLVARFLEHVSTADRDPRPHFAWLHLIGPHEPYVRAHGASFVLMVRRNYALEVARSDAALGALVRGLERSPRAARTLLVVTADHGEAFGEHRSIRHNSSLYEPELAVPFVSVWLSSGGDAPVELPRSHTDLRGYLRAVVEGRSFEAPDGHLAVLRDQVAFITPRYKLLVERNAARVSLFDLVRDPGERHDLSRRDPARLRELGRRLGDAYAALR